MEAAAGQRHDARSRTGGPKETVDEVLDDPALQTHAVARLQSILKDKHLQAQGSEALWSTLKNTFVPSFAGKPPKALDIKTPPPPKAVPLAVPVPAPVPRNNGPLAVQSPAPAVAKLSPPVAAKPAAPNSSSGAPLPVEAIPPYTSSLLPPMPPPAVAPPRPN